MGLNWERASLSSYFEALEAHNAAHDPKPRKATGSSDTSALSRFMKAHGDG